MLEATVRTDSVLIKKTRLEKEIKILQFVFILENLYNTTGIEVGYMNNDMNDC